MSSKLEKLLGSAGRARKEVSEIREKKLALPEEDASSLASIAVGLETFEHEVERGAFDEIGQDRVELLEVQVERIGDVARTVTPDFLTPIVEVSKLYEQVRTMLTELPGLGGSGNKLPPTRKR